MQHVNCLLAYALESCQSWKKPCFAGAEIPTDRLAPQISVWDRPTLL